ncbi:MAG: Fe-Mn family superoxide dismutase [Candidatus Caenarcaniphilales bacterium]|nr:Fe-Mn family superoxide dismutase [Candidatus Caenarcaniphilales bacterium]
MIPEDRERRAILKLGILGVAACFGAESLAGAVTQSEARQVPSLKKMSQSGFSEKLLQAHLDHFHKLECSADQIASGNSVRPPSPEGLKEYLKTELKLHRHYFDQLQLGAILALPASLKDHFQHQAFTHNGWCLITRLRGNYLIKNLPDNHIGIDLSGEELVMAIDLEEHAYFLDFGRDKAAYLTHLSQGIIWFDDFVNG